MDSVNTAMAYPRRILEAYLSTWELEESGQLGDAPLNLVGELIYPRPMIDRREHTLTVPHVLGEPVDWNDQPFHQRILFKEVVEGPFSLGFTLLRQSDEGALNRLVQSVLESSEGSGEPEIRSSAVLPPMAQVVTSAVDLGLESRLEKELGDVVASGYLELHSEDIRKDERLTTELIAPVSIENPRPDPQPERHTGYREVLKQSGQPNGSLEIRLRVQDR